MYIVVYYVYLSLSLYSYYRTCIYYYIITCIHHIYIHIIIYILMHVFYVIQIGLATPQSTAQGLEHSTILQQSQPPGGSLGDP